MFHFAGFELDETRAELRVAGGAAVKLRPKTFEMLLLFVKNAGRIVSKQELMDAIWPNTHVGEDGLFQCIRELRAALGDDQRELIKLVSGRGYLLALDLAVEPVGVDSASVDEIPRRGPGLERAAPERTLFGVRRSIALAAITGLCLVIALGVAAFAVRNGVAVMRTTPSIAVMPVVAMDAGQGKAIAVGVTDRLIDGLAQIDNIRVLAPPSVAASDVRELSGQADFVLRGELQRDGQLWTLTARMIEIASGEVRAVATVSVDAGAADGQLQQSRLAAGIGDQLARQLNVLLESGADPIDSSGAAPGSDAKVVIQQAMASINQTSRERFAAAQAMLETSRAVAPENIDLQVALAGLETRGIQMVWYSAGESVAAESNARLLLESALRTRPRSMPVLEAYCRFLSATHNFVEALVACAKALSFDPWNGSALYQIGLSQVFLGRFEDALVSFEEADRFDTPAVSRWTWLLGAGLTSLLMDHNQEATTWLERSIAITPGSGRSHLLLAVAYQRLGRPGDARAALAEGLALRPGSTAVNVQAPARNTSPLFQKESRRIAETMIEIGLPES